MKIIQARTEHLYIEQFQALPGQAWTLLGTNRSGIEDFFNLVSGRHLKGRVAERSLPDQPGVVSFKDQQAVYESELKKDQTDFMDHPLRHLGQRWPCVSGSRRPGAGIRPATPQI